MKTYSEDLRQKVIRAVQECGISESQDGHLFGLSLSSVMRYTELYARVESLAPKQRGGRLPNLHRGFIGSCYIRNPGHRHAVVVSG